MRGKEEIRAVEGRVGVVLKRKEEEGEEWQWIGGGRRELEGERRKFSPSNH